MVFTRREYQSNMDFWVVAGCGQRTMVVHWDCQTSTKERTSLMLETWLPHELLAGDDLRVLSVALWLT